MPKLPKMPKGTKPTERSFAVQYVDNEGDIRESGTWRNYHLYTFQEADSFAKQVKGTVIGWDDEGSWSVVVDYSKKPTKKMKEHAHCADCFMRAECKKSTKSIDLKSK